LVRSVLYNLLVQLVQLVLGFLVRLLDLDLLEHLVILGYLVGRQGRYKEASGEYHNLLVMVLVTGEDHNLLVVLVVAGEYHNLLVVVVVLFVVVVVVVLVVVVVVLVVVVVVRILPPLHRFFERVQHR
jgi:hypothetical protein